MYRRRISLMTLAGTAVATSLAFVNPAGASGSGITSQSALQIVTAAERASGAANSFTVVGSVGQGSQRVGLNLTVSNKKLAQGSVTEGGQTIYLIQVGNTVYFKANKIFWTQNGGAAAAQLFAGRWVSGPVSSADFSSFSQFLDSRQLANQFFSAPTGTSFHKGSVTTVNGQRVISITGTGTGKAGEGSGVVYVATSGKPYIVKVAITKSSSGNGTVTFSNYNKPVHASVPKGAINISQLQG